MLYVNGRSIDEYEGVTVVPAAYGGCVVMCFITIPQLSSLLWLNWNELRGLGRQRVLRTFTIGRFVIVLILILSNIKIENLKFRNFNNNKKEEWERKRFFRMTSRHLVLLNLQFNSQFDLNLRGIEDSCEINVSSDVAGMMKGLPLDDLHMLRFGCCLPAQSWFP